jgi:hypothetical protein
MSLALLTACGLGCVLACDRDAPEPSTFRPDLQILETRPEPQDTAFPLERALRLRFDRYLLPPSVVRQSVVVTPSLIDAETGAPKGPTVFFEPVYDPCDRIVVFQLASRARWVPSTLHSVRLLAPRDQADVAGFRAFDGAPLAEQVDFSFMTGDAVTDPSEDVDDVMPRVRYCEEDEGLTTLPAVASVLRSSCALAGCHGSSPMLGLDLSGSTAIRSTAVRVVARQTMTGPSVAAPVTNPSRFGDDMPRLEPGNAGNSYLVYKLLVHAGNHPATGETLDAPDPWLGGMAPPGPPPLAELSRLRSWFVRGEPMPLGGHLGPDEMRAIVRWVLQGAPTADCAP